MQQFSWPLPSLLSKHKSTDHGLQYIQYLISGSTIKVLTHDIAWHLSQFPSLRNLQTLFLSQHNVHFFHLFPTGSYVWCEWDGGNCSFHSLLSPLCISFVVTPEKLNWCRHCNASSWSIFVLMCYVRIPQTRPSQHSIQQSEGQNHPIALLF